MEISYTDVIAIDAQAEQAEAMAERCKAWMLRNNYIKGELSDCVPEGSGYAASEGFKMLLYDKEDADMLGYPFKGVEFLTGRRVFDSGIIGVNEMTCNACMEDIDDGSWESSINDLRNGGVGLFVCPHCKVEAPVDQGFNAYPSITLSYFGIRFWNSLHFNQQFISTFEMETKCYARVSTGTLEFAEIEGWYPDIVD